ncbi:energy transducer TonB [Methylacidiphilum caldifontis]|uniref:energy transducer TonB n=1 Tax=Methylacidiphilum caldifontis TaxID=2795386 RepID=UPI001A8CD7AD|nr:energy transducer TonB [Methylacidiphilum caldifontis]QSR88957.1 energy transducer TonB [Methylacidiphilum caldifontis]
MMGKIVYQIACSLSRDKLIFGICLFLAASVHGLIALVSLSHKDIAEKTEGLYSTQSDSSSFVDLVSAPESPFLTSPLLKNEEPKISLPSPSMPQNHTAPLTLNKTQIIQKKQGIHSEAKGNTPCLARKDYKEYNLSTSFLSPPPYPYEARLHHMEGTVVIMLDIRQGKIVSSRIVRSSGHSLLDITAKHWIDTHWKFPSHISRTVIESITFELENSSPPINEKYYQASYLPR